MESNKGGSRVVMFAIQGVLDLVGGPCEGMCSQNVRGVHR
jgi:hypothetical protein